MSPDWLSNTYLIGDLEGGEGAFVDAGGPVAPLLELVESKGLTITHILLTHHHHDHVAELGELIGRFPDAAVMAHADEPILGVNETLQPGEHVQVGELDVEALPTPGHTKGMLSFRVGNAVFTGDTLFKGSVGGVRAPGHTTYADLRSSIMDTLMELPPDTDHPARAHRRDDGRRGVGAQRVHPRLARPRPRGRRAVHGAGRAGDARPAGRPTTTAATRPGCAGRTARDDIVPGSQVQPRS